MSKNAFQLANQSLAQRHTRNAKQMPNLQLFPSLQSETSVVLSRVLFFIWSSLHLAVHSAADNSGHGPSVHDNGLLSVVHILCNFPLKFLCKGTKRMQHPQRKIVLLILELIVAFFFFSGFVLVPLLSVPFLLITSSIALTLLINLIRDRDRAVCG